METSPPLDTSLSASCRRGMVRTRENVQAAWRSLRGRQVAPTTSTSIPSPHPAPMPTVYNSSPLSSMYTAQPISPSSSALPHGPGVTLSQSNTAPLHTQASPSSHSPIVGNSTATSIPIADPRTIIATAEQKLRDACKSQNATLALEAKAMLAHAANLLKFDDTATSLRYQFASRRCEDIFDLITHGIRVGDYRKICYADIDQHLKAYPPRTTSPTDSFDYFLRNNPLVKKLSDTIVALLQQGRLQDAFEHVKKTGEYYYKEYCDFMFAHCQRELAFLALAMANQDIKKENANKAKIELFRAAKSLGTLDFTMSVKILYESLRCETACELISRKYQLADIEAFLNENAAPATRNPIIDAFYALGSTKDAATTGETRVRPLQRGDFPHLPVPLNRGPTSYRYGVYHNIDTPPPPSPFPPISTPVQSQSSTSSSRSDTPFAEPSETIEAFEPSHFTVRRATEEEWRQLTQAYTSHHETTPAPSSSSSSPPAPGSYRAWLQNNPQVAELDQKYTAECSAGREEQGREILKQHAEAAAIAGDHFMNAHCHEAIGLHFLLLACETGRADLAAAGNSHYLGASQILKKIDREYSAVCTYLSKSCLLAWDLLGKGFQIQDVEDLVKYPDKYEAMLKGM